MIRTFGGRSPRIHPTAFVHDGAEILGAVSVGRQASIWPAAVLRGDVDAIRVGERSNVQDGAVLHCREGLPAVVGRGVTIGHRAIVHGARIGDYCLIGMGAVVMEATLGAECLVAAGAVVPKGLRVPPRSLVMGLPARAHRRLTTQELRHLHESAASYVALAEKHRRTSRAVF